MKPAIFAHIYALAVVPHAGRYLLIQERKHGQTWYLPAGRVEPGENPVVGAMRETLEESGVTVRIRGVLWIDHEAGVGAGGSWCKLRFVFVATPLVEAAPTKSIPDQHSLRAAWFTREEIARLDLRSDEVLEHIDRLERLAPILPLASYRSLPTEPALPGRGASRDFAD